MCEIQQKGMISCQLSFYPLGRADYLPPIEEVLSLIKNSGLKYKVGETSTLIIGAPGQMFSLLQNVTERMDKSGCKFAMSASISNVCGLE